MKGWSPDLVITDLRMPNMDGLELFRAIPVESRVPIIVWSVKGEDAVKVESLDAGADDYVPSRVNELLCWPESGLHFGGRPRSIQRPR